MISVSGFKFIHRPYPYEREPFLVASGENVPFRDIFFSRPAYGLLADKRLFSLSTVSSPIKLYINKDANNFTSIEPRLDGSGYSQATPHYADYILDLRTLLGDVVTAHANDSTYSADDFFSSHMQRNRESVYDMDNSSASGLSTSEYTHDPLGSHYLEDIDMDEIMWQPFSRPGKKNTYQNIPIAPVFPMALPNGNIPSFTSSDVSTYSKLALNAPGSGGVLVTGDALVPGTVISLVNAPGKLAVSTGSHLENVDWALFPGTDNMDSYGYNEFVNDDQIGTVTASGRQAIYENPGTIENDVVLMLNIATPGSSGYLVSNWPANYYATSGVDADGWAHDGVHIIDRVLIDSPVVGKVTVGRSPINGKRVFGHVSSSDQGPNGELVGTLHYYKDGSVIRSFGGLVQQNTNVSQVYSYGSTPENLSNHTFSQVTTNVFEPRQVNIWGPPVYGSTYNPGRQTSVSDGKPWLMHYALNGTVDKMCYPGQINHGGAAVITGTLNATSLKYSRLETAPGVFTSWQPFYPYGPGSNETTSTSTVKYTENVFDITNWYPAVSNKVNFGFRRFKNQAHLQYSLNPIPHPFAYKADYLLNVSNPILEYYTHPPQPVLTTIQYVSFGALNGQIKTVTTFDREFNIPSTLNPSDIKKIDFEPALGLTNDDNVYRFGPIMHDDQTGENYIYWEGSSDGGFNSNQQYFFGKINSDAKIYYYNRVPGEDAILGGNPLVLSL